MLTHLSLFSGIGGLDLAAEWAGFTTIGMVERDPFCQRVLAKHWPEVPIYDDVTTFDGTGFRGVDLLSGGFPCQDISGGGKGAGITGARSGLWVEMARIINESRPSWVVVENSPFLRIRGADKLLSDLEEAGYTAMPLVVGADHAGAPFRGERCFVVASTDERWESAHRRQRALCKAEAQERRGGIDARRVQSRNSGQWSQLQPRPFGVAHGIPNRVDRLRALGNAVVPQQVYPIIKAIADTLRP